MIAGELEHWLKFPLEPVAKGRHRSFVQRGEVRHVSSRETAIFERDVKRLATFQWKGAKPLEGPLRVVMLFRMTKPEEGSGKKGSKMDEPFCVPDIDNLVKAVCDGLNRVVWKDDAQICELCCKKVWVSGRVEKSGIDVWVEPMIGANEC